MRRPIAPLQVDTAGSSSSSSIDLTQSPSSSIHFNDVDFKKQPESISDSSSISTPTTTTTTPEQNGPAPSTRLLFSLLSRRQYLLLLLPAFISSTIAGGIAPFMTHVIGQSFDAFARFPLTSPSQSDKDALLHGVGLAAIQLVGLAIGALGLSSITSALWIWLGESNAMQIRKTVYKGVTAKEMVWFDTRMGAEGNVLSLDDEQGPMGAGGLMAKFAR